MSAFSLKRGHVFYTRQGGLVTAHGFPLTIGSSGGGGGGGAEFTDILPAIDNTYVIGDCDSAKRWKSVAVGPDGYYICNNTSGAETHIVSSATATRTATFPDATGNIVLDTAGVLTITNIPAGPGDMLIAGSATTANWQTPPPIALNGDLYPGQDDFYNVGNSSPLRWRMFHAGTVGYYQNGSKLLTRPAVGSIEIGVGSVAGATRSIAFGEGTNIASAGNSIAIGFGTQVTNTFSVAVGNNAIIGIGTGTGHVAIGFSSACAPPGGLGCVALGSNAQANFDNSIALGHGVSTAAAGEFAVSLDATGLGLCLRHRGAITASRVITWADSDGNVVLDTTGALIISGAAPVAGQVLTATSATTADWQASVGTANVTNTNGPFTIAGVPAAGQIIQATGAANGVWASLPASPAVSSGSDSAFAGSIVFYNLGQTSDTLIAIDAQRRIWTQVGNIVTCGIYLSMRRQVTTPLFSNSGPFYLSVPIPVPCVGNCFPVGGGSVSLNTVNYPPDGALYSSSTNNPDPKSCDIPVHGWRADHFVGRPMFFNPPQNNATFLSQVRLDWNEGIAAVFTVYIHLRLHFSYDQTL